MPQAERKQTQSFLGRLNDFVQSVLNEVSGQRRSASGIAGN